LTWKLFEGDCFDVLPSIEDGSIDMVLCDLPYGTTACKWDTPLPLDKLWTEYERVIKDNGAIVLTASQPFTSALVMSNPKLFRYDMSWNKRAVTGFLNANRMPLRAHEDILLFYKKLPVYNPQKTPGKPYIKNLRGQAEHYGKFDPHTPTNLSGDRYPTSVLTIHNGNRSEKIHPTQKPVALFEYLIKTYTNLGDLVLDNCAGSGTTGVACENTGRNSILMEKEPEYCQIIRERLQEHTQQTLQVEARKQQTLLNYIPAK